MKFACRALVFFGLFGFAEPGFSETKIEISAPTSRIGEHKLEILEYRSKKPPVLKIEADSRLIKCVLDGQSCSESKDIELRIESGPLREQTKKLETVEADGTTTSVDIVLLPGLRGVSSAGHSKTGRNVLLAFGHELLVLAPDGQLIFHHHDAKDLWDLQEFEVGGHPVYAYFVADASNIGVNSEGHRVLLNSDFEVIDRFDEKEDGHEFIVLGKKHYLFTRYRDETEKDGTCFLDQRIVEWKDGKEIATVGIRQLLAADVLGKKLWPVDFKGRSCRSKGHLNSAQIVSPDRWLISTGESATVLWNLKSSRPEWVLGGEGDQFRLPTEQRSSFQHSAQWIESEKRLVLFDNGHEKKLSRLLDYVLDVTAKKVVSFRQVGLDGAFANAGGSVFLENGIYTVGLGDRTKGTNDVLEIEGGRTTFSVRLSEAGSPGLFLYRAHRGL